MPNRLNNDIHRETDGSNNMFNSTVVDVSMGCKANIWE